VPGGGESPGPAVVRGGNETSGEGKPSRPRQTEGDLGHQLFVRTFALRGCWQPGKPSTASTGDPQWLTAAGDRGTGTDGRMGPGLSSLASSQGRAAVVAGQQHCCNRRPKGGAGPALAPRGSSPLPGAAAGCRNPRICAVCGGPPAAITGLPEVALPARRPAPT